MYLQLLSRKYKERFTIPAELFSNICKKIGFTLLKIVYEIVKEIVRKNN